MPLLYWRIARNIFRKRRHRARFLAASPLIVFYLTIWAAGEAVGYIFGGQRLEACRVQCLSKPKNKAQITVDNQNSRCFLRGQLPLDFVIQYHHVLAAAGGYIAARLRDNMTAAVSARLKEIVG